MDDIDKMLDKMLPEEEFSWSVVVLPDGLEIKIYYNDSLVSKGVIAETTKIRTRNNEIKELASRARDYTGD